MNPIAPHRPVPPQAPVLESAPNNASVCLGLRLSNREIGYALTTRRDVLDYGVLNIRKLNSQSTKETRFQQVIGQRLTRLRPQHLAVLAPLPHQITQPLTQAFTAWLTQTAHHHQITLHTVAQDALKQGYLTEDTHQITQRDIAQALCRRFPELSALRPPTPVPIQGPLAPGEPVRFKTHQRNQAKARYWGQMFLALAAAVRVLDAQLTDIPIPKPPPRSNGIPNPPQR